jgi:hypothetical protein
LSLMKHNSHHSSIQIKSLLREASPDRILNRRDEARETKRKKLVEKTEGQMLGTGI